MKQLSTILLAMTWLVLGASQVSAGRASGALPPATLKSVTVADPSVGRELLLRIDGEYSFKTIHTPEGDLYVDLQGTRAGGIPPSAKWSGGFLAGYQLLQYSGAGGVPVVRMEIRTRAPSRLPLSGSARVCVFALVRVDPSPTLRLRLSRLRCPLRARRWAGRRSYRISRCGPGPKGKLHRRNHHKTGKLPGFPVEESRAAGG